MAFPTTAQLDALNRTFESPLANGTWSNPVESGHDFMRTQASLGAEAHISATNCDSYWSAATFGPDCEAWSKVSVAMVSDSYVTLYARITNVGSGTLNCYRLKVFKNVGAANDAWTLDKIVSGSVTTIGTGTQEIGSTDGFGLECIGTAIKCYHFTGGSWNQTPIISVTDSGVTGSGNIALGANTSGAPTFAPFGGGTISGGGATFKNVPQFLLLGLGL